MRILVRGAGVAGLAVAHELTEAGARVTVAAPPPGSRAPASWFAGGMLAPWCERESAPDRVLTLGVSAADWWERVLPGSVTRNGTLVVAPARDRRELARFAARTSGFDRIDADTVARLEPDLAGRFSEALFFPREAHLDPREALTRLRETLASRGVLFVHEAQAEEDAGFERIVDCTGPARIGATPGLRGVRGEMAVLACPDVTLSRPVRLLHPRIPLYIVPRGEGRVMCGATMIESDDDGPIAARSLMELLNAAYALHPAFAEARILETGTGIRPAFTDNLPRVTEEGRTIRVNGFYRHGFLLAPAIAAQATARAIGTQPADRRRA
ncbi:glycine oxidase ThiO [Ensifer soli]|uniref:glycine oxidase ThiO n=1 Tax=Ciceribacter sp. sgz301302 TaxID=3342379 RepID=UPI0035B7DFD9